MAIIDGTSGNDNLAGNFGEDDLIRGFEGDDTLFGRSGDDTLEGGDGDDTLWGEEGDDVLVGGAGHDILRGGDGDDELDGGAGTGSLEGEDGNDVIHARGGGMQVDGGAGDDYVRVYGAGDFTLQGGQGQDRLGVDFSDSDHGFSLDLTNMWLGLSGSLSAGAVGFTQGVESFETLDSTLRGSDFDDRLVIGSAFSANLWLYMGAGDDEAEGGSGNDWIEGGDGDDVLRGMSGYDYIVGGLGDDILDGGALDDILTPGEGANQVLGGSGNDTVILTGVGSGSIDGEQGQDTLQFTLADAVAGATVDLSNLWSGGTGQVGSYSIQNVEALSGHAIEGSAFNDIITIGAAYTPGVDISGGDGNDQISGGSGGDILRGGAGDDILDGLGGTNTLQGGTGNDTYVVGNGTTTVTELADGGIDTVRTALDYTLGANIENLILTGTGWHTAYGNALNNVITGGSGDSEMLGAAGDDLIHGGNGDDILHGEAGDDTLNGDGGDDLLFGGAGDNVMNGGGGDDLVWLSDEGTNHADGGIGVDQLFIAVAGATGNTVDLSDLWSGGAGSVNGGLVQGFEVLFDETVYGTVHNDSYILGSTYTALDLVSGVTLEAREGDDVVEGTAGEDAFYGGQGDDELFGAGRDDQLYGGDGADVLDGGTGNDTLVGGAGDDTYYIDSLGDVVDESGGGGVDLVNVAYPMAYVLGAGIEDAAIWGWHNSTLTGNALDNALSGGTPIESIGVLVGGGGDDALYFGHEMRGGVGDDTYHLSANDIDVDQAFRAIEAANEGYDTIYFSTSHGVIPDNIEAAASTSEDGAFITGNALDNRILGQWFGASDSLNGMAGNDTLEGFDGNDSLTGGSGDDTLLGGDGNDSLAGAAGIDILSGGSGNDVLNGGADNDDLSGGAGADTLIGGGGIDTARYSDATSGVKVYLNTGTGGAWAAGDTYSSIENVIGSNHADLLVGDGANNYLHGGGGADEVKGGAGNDQLLGAAGDDILEGGDGNDNLAGGDNRDTLQGDAGDDVLNGGSGVDKLFAGSGTDHLIGGADNDKLNGGSDNDILDGGQGNDILTGGSGDDLFVFRGASGSDTITDFRAGAGLRDVISFSTSLFVNLADVKAHTTNDGLGNCVISKNGVVITLTGVTINQLIADDFEFVAAAPADLPGKTLEPLTLPGPDPLDPLILPTGLDSKATPEDAPLVLPGSDAFVAEVPGQAFGARPALWRDDIDIRDYAWVV